MAAAGIGGPSCANPGAGAADSPDSAGRVARRPSEAYLVWAATEDDATRLRAALQFELHENRRIANTRDNMRASLRFDGV